MDYWTHMANYVIFNNTYDPIESFVKQIHIGKAPLSHFWVHVLQDILLEEIL